MQSKHVLYRKFAIGYNPMDVERFIFIHEPFIDVTKEFYFSWPYEPSGRDMPEKSTKESYLADLTDSMTWARKNGCALDLLFNANCYGEIAYHDNMRRKVNEIINYLGNKDLLPEVVTTTSEYVAKILKLDFPEIKVRASVNMHLNSTTAMEYISDIFDSFYISRDIQRDLSVLRMFSFWAERNGKDICLLANSACVRCCPVYTFHNNLIAHSSLNGLDAEYVLQYPFRLCERIFRVKHDLIQVLKMSWIRPEDIKYYEPYVSVVKLATRCFNEERRLIRAYAEGYYDGNLLDLLGMPAYTYLDNTAFPDDWVASGIAQTCAINCTHCGKCDEIWKKINKPTQSRNYSFTGGPIIIR